jgi:quinol monooxygenase YgiN
VIAKWRARSGCEEEIEGVLRELAPASRAEPGCRRYLVTRSATEPGRYVLFEEYDDEAAFQAHRESEHFKRLVLKDGARFLESRDVTFYEMVG